MPTIDPMFVAIMCLSAAAAIWILWPIDDDNDKKPPPGGGSGARP